MAQDLRDIVERYLQSDAVSIPSEFRLPKNGQNVLTIASSFRSDTSIIIGSRINNLIFFIGKNSSEELLRQRAVNFLLSDIRNDDTGYIINNLVEFNRSDFNEQSKDSLRSIFYAHPVNFEQFVKLLGFAEVYSLKESIRLLTYPTHGQGLRWAAFMALARMGDTYSVQNIITRVQKLPINDDVVQTIFPDLVYTRQKPAIDYLVQVMNSNEKNCTSANPNSEEKIVCGYRIMEMLAPAIEGYPLELDASGDIKTTNYEEALATVRAWFASNPDYVINRDTY